MTPSSSPRPSDWRSELGRILMFVGAVMVGVAIWALLWLGILGLIGE